MLLGLACWWLVSSKMGGRLFRGDPTLVGQHQLIFASLSKANISLISI